MSKAEKIRELYAKGHSTREIADSVGCRAEYVRVAARQRANGKQSEIDKRYYCRRYGTSDIREAYRRHGAEERSWDWSREAGNARQRRYRARKRAEASA